MKDNYYNPKKILSMKDINKNEPSIYIISTNRSAGKTTSMLKLSLEHYKETGRKTILLYRYNYELNSAHEIFRDVLNIYPDLGTEMKSMSQARGLFYELFLDDESFGYALSLNNPDSLKKFSPLFAEIDYIIFDEYQTESGKYLSKEVDKLQSILMTVARGGGSQSRNVKLFMLSNMVTIMNPYFIAFGIHKRLRSDTKFLRGNGFVAEFGFNESASTAIKQNGLFKPFENSNYVNYSTNEREYLIASEAFIDKPKGKNKYIFTIIHENIAYGVRDCFESGILHISSKVDKSCKMVVTFKASDHNQNTMMLQHYSFLWRNVRDAYFNGMLRFDDIKTKNAIYDILGIDLYK